MVLQQWGIKCRSCFPIPSCLQLRGGVHIPCPSHSCHHHRPHGRVPKTRLPGMLYRPIQTQQETESPSQEIGNCRLGRCERGCRASEECRALEGSLGDTTHLHSGGDAEHLQCTTEARYFSSSFFPFFFGWDVIGPFLCSASSMCFFAQQT